MRVRRAPWLPFPTLTILIGIGLGSGCPREEQTVKAGVEDAGPGTTGPGVRVGVQVPMPSGWTARIGADQSFQAGPPGTALMRIDRQPGAASALPSPARLREGLEVKLGAGALETVSEEHEDGFSLLVFEVQPGAVEDGGSPLAAQPGVLAAKAVGRDLYLCASQPGAGAADVRSIIQACREITVRAAE